MLFFAPFSGLHKLLQPSAVSRVVLFWLLVVFGGIAPLQAHEIRPAIADVTITAETVDVRIRLTLESLVAGLDLTELQDTNASPLATEYDALRSLPPEDLAAEFALKWTDIKTGIFLAAGSTRLAPEFTQVSVDPIGDIELTRESTIHLNAVLPDDGSPITLGWQASYGPLVVRQVLASNDGYSGYLAGGDISEPMPRLAAANQPWFTTFSNFVGIGFEHIVPKGLDHILFVLGLFFFSLNLRPLLTQITAFTVAHTVTLASASLGIIQISASIVEPLIAASIVYVAVENVLFRDLKPWRTAVVFGFGLLHGLGFASVLGDIGLNPGRFFTGLIGFNIGVELGQLAVIAAAFFSVGYWFGAKPWYGAVISRPASVGIAIVGAYWFVQRVFF